MATKIIKNPAVLHYFKTDIKKNMKFFIICLALHMLSLPLLFATMTYDTFKKGGSYTYLSEFFIVTTVIFTGLAILAGVLIAINNYSYLHKKQESDTYMSLPLSDKQRFFTNYFSGLVTYILPVVISGVFSFISLGIFIGAVTSDAGKDSYFSYEPLIYGDHTIHWFELFFTAYFLVILAMIMFYTITVLACTLCGSIFEAIVHVVILNGIIPGLIALVSFVMFNKVPTMSWYTVMLPVLSKTSPIGAVISYFLYAEFIEYDILLLPFILKFSFWLIAFTALYLGVSFLLYKFRKAEDVAKPYVFKSYYYIIMTCITFAFIAAIPAYWEVLISPILVATVVFYLIFEIITNRGFKNFGFSVIRCVATIVISFVLIMILNNSWSFGIGKRVPKAESVKSVSINYTSLDNAVDRYNDYMNFTDEDIIKIITDYHKDAVEYAYDNLYSTSFMEYNDYYYHQTYEVTYKLKNGTSFTRFLPCTNEMRITLAEIETYDEYINDRTEYIYEDIYDRVVFEPLLGDSYEYLRIRDDGIYHGGIAENSIEVSEEEFEKFKKELSKAIKLDLSDRTYEQIVSPYACYGLLDISLSSMYVYEYDEHILSVLKKYGIYTTTPKQYLEENCAEVNPFSQIFIAYYDKYDFHSYEDYEKTDKSYRYFGYNPSSEREHELMLELATKLAPFNFDSENPYVLERHYKVPKKYEHLAEELYKLGSRTQFEDWYDVEYDGEQYDDYYYEDEELVYYE